MWVPLALTIRKVCGDKRQLTAFCPSTVHKIASDALARHARTM
jgi:hypothetical protein